MSDNKTPIELSIEVLNSRIKELEGNVKETGRRSSIATRVAEIKRTIENLKSHLALEEEAIKENKQKLFGLLESCYDLSVMKKHGDFVYESFPSILSGLEHDISEYFNKTFKPE